MGFVRDHSYPLYYQITYERKNTQVKSYFNKYYYSLEEVAEEEPELIRFERNILQRVVSYETTRGNGTFTLSGIKGKYEVYITPLHDIFENSLKKKLLKALKYCQSEFLHILKFEGFDVTFSLLYKAVKLLIKGFDSYLDDDFKIEIAAYQAFLKAEEKEDETYQYVTVLDWLDSDYKIRLQDKFLTNFQLNLPLSEKYISILNYIVEEKAKLI